MENTNTLRNIVFIIIGLWVFIYLVIAFIKADVNSFNWSAELRGQYVGISVALSGLSFPTYKLLDLD
jgi:hypothetical protein